MAPGPAISGEEAAATTMSASSSVITISEPQKSPNTDSKSESRMSDIADRVSSLTLNPMAEEFFPSSYSTVNGNHDQHGLALNYLAPYYQNSTGNQIEGDPINHWMRNNDISDTRLCRAFRADRIKRTVYVSDIDKNVSENQLGAIFSAYGHVLDCCICADPQTNFRFGFVEYGDEDSARAALNLCGAILVSSRISVFPSRGAISHINPSLLPQSEDEMEMCARTVYCTNIDKQVSQAVLKCFFEARCGEVSRMRLLWDRTFLTRIAFIEFVTVESAIVALDCSGKLLGELPIRVRPSKTPMRSRRGRPLPAS